LLDFFRFRLSSSTKIILKPDEFVSNLMEGLELMPK
jgi:hypothetical protein